MTDNNYQDVEQESNIERTTDGYRTHFNSEFVTCDYCGTENKIGKSLEGYEMVCQKCSCSFTFSK